MKQKALSSTYPYNNICWTSTVPGTSQKLNNSNNNAAFVELHTGENWVRIKKMMQKVNDKTSYSWEGKTIIGQES